MSIDPSTTAITKESLDVADEPNVEVSVQKIEVQEVTELKKLKKRKKRKKKKRKDSSGISKDTIGIVRTKLRNNVELTNIADNKANVLLSLNALMLTFFIPLTIPNIDLIVEQRLVIPVMILVLSSLATISLAVLALRPGKFSGQNIKIDDKSSFSPFFFGNFEKLQKDEYVNYLTTTLQSDIKVVSFLSNDFYHIGLRLGQKMRIVRRAFNIFILGLCSSILLSAILILIK